MSSADDGTSQRMMLKWHCQAAYSRLWWRQLKGSAAN